MPIEQPAPELERIMSVDEEIRAPVLLLVGLVALLLAVGVACGNPSTPTSEPPVLLIDPSPTALEPTGAVKSTDAPRSTPHELTIDEETVIKGVVTGKNLGCHLDLPCFLRIIANSREIVVIYHFGEYPRCLNQAAVDFGEEAVVGDEVEVFGKVMAGNEISTCDSTDYYIRKDP